MMGTVTHTRQKQDKQRNRMILQAQKAMKKGDWEGALQGFRRAASVQGSAKMDKTIFQLEEKLIAKKFIQEYDYMTNCQKYDKRFDRICSKLEQNFDIWPVHQRVLLLLKNSHWEEADSHWLRISPSLIDPLLAGRYHLRRGQPWRALMTWRPIFNDQRLDNTDKDSLTESLCAHFDAPPYPLVRDIDVTSLQWLTSRMPAHIVRTMVCCHLAHFLYDGEWRKGERRYAELREKLSHLKWEDEPVSQGIATSFRYWKIRSSHCHNPREKVAQVETILRDMGIDRHTKLYQNLLEFCHPGKDEMHWTALCENNPYKLVGLEKSAMDQKEIMNLFNKAVKRGSHELGKLLAIQRVLRNSELQAVLKFLFLPI